MEKCGYTYNDTIMRELLLINKLILSTEIENEDSYVPESTEQMAEEGDNCRGTHELLKK